MKKTVWLGILVSPVVIATAFLVLHHRRAAPLTSPQAASPDMHAQWSVWSFGTEWMSMGGVPDADERDDDAYAKMPESKTEMAKIMKIYRAVEARRYEGPTADEAVVVINCMHSPYYTVRKAGAVIAGYARSDPARSVLLPHVVGLLSDRVSVVRLFAAFTLGNMGDKSVIFSLKLLLKDPIPLVTRAAQEAISKLQNQKEAVTGK